METEMMKVFAKTIENTCKEQLEQFMKSEASVGAKVRIMPDTHAGKGCVIGFTMTIQDRVVPNLVGVDIGCGMLALEVEKVDPKDFIKMCKKVPVGNKVHQKPMVDFDLSGLVTKIDDKRKEHIRCSLGTLGSGNHFIELNEMSDGKMLVVIHTGSRNLGVQVCQYHQSLAGKGDLAYLQGQQMKDYLNDMKITQKYAQVNRQMIKEILIQNGLKVTSEFETVHNYISFDDMILRKGAISCHKGEKVLIPLNMRDGSLIGIGKGNEDWNYSGPHGAGRLMSRGEAKRKVTLEQFQESMKGIYSETVLTETIDESPMCYKDASEIKELIKETVDIVDHVKVLANFKGF